jgi:hypothetical protein
MNFLSIKKETLLLFAVVSFIVVFSVWFFGKEGDSEVFNQSDNSIREIDMITAEFKTKTKDGKDIIAYRWDPGTVFLEKGEKVNLYISGVNGEDHPFYIEGTDIQGTVKKGEETIVPLQF